MSDSSTAYASLLAGYVIPGDADGSVLMELLTTSDEADQMPPPDYDRLPEADVALVREWIDSGAAQ